MSTRIVAVIFWAGKRSYRQWLQLVLIYLNSLKSASFCKVDLSTTTQCLMGSTENSGLENSAPKLQVWKRKDQKMRERYCLRRAFFCAYVTAITRVRGRQSRVTLACWDNGLIAVVDNRRFPLISSAWRLTIPLSMLRFAIRLTDTLAVKYSKCTSQFIKTPFS